MMGSVKMADLGADITALTHPISGAKPNQLIVSANGPRRAVGAGHAAKIRGAPCSALVDT